MVIAVDRDAVHKKLKIFSGKLSRRNPMANCKESDCCSESRMRFGVVKLVDRMVS